MTEHCSHCGADNPGTHDGYTGCCNEPTCSGNGTATWELVNNLDERANRGTVDACCGATAEKAAKARGLHIGGLLPSRW